MVQPADGMLPLTPRARGQMRFIEQAPAHPDRAAVPDGRSRAAAELGALRGGLGPAADRLTGDINPRQIVQTRDAVVILTEYGPDLRIIPFTRQARPARRAAPLGDSIARWEGDTLVIETIGLPAKDAIRPFPTLFVPPRAKVIERYTRVSKTELLYQYTVVDPAIYTAPWLAEYSLYAHAKPISSSPATRATIRCPTSWPARGPRRGRSADPESVSIQKRGEPCWPWLPLAGLHFSALDPAQDHHVRDL